MASGFVDHVHRRALGDQHRGEHVGERVFAGAVARSDVAVGQGEGEGRVVHGVLARSQVRTLGSAEAAAATVRLLARRFGEAHHREHRGEAGAGDVALSGDVEFERKADLTFCAKLPPAKVIVPISLPLELTSVIAGQKDWSGPTRASASTHARTCRQSLSGKGPPQAGWSQSSWISNTPASNPLPLPLPPPPPPLLGAPAAPPLSLFVDALLFDVELEAPPLPVVELELPDSDETLELSVALELANTMPVVAVAIVVDVEPEVEPEVDTACAEVLGPPLTELWLLESPLQAAHSTAVSARASKGPRPELTVLTVDWCGKCWESLRDGFVHELDVLDHTRVLERAVGGAIGACLVIQGQRVALGGVVAGRDRALALERGRAEAATIRIGAAGVGETPSLGEQGLDEAAAQQVALGWDLELTCDREADVLVVAGRSKADVAGDLAIRRDDLDAVAERFDAREQRVSLDAET